MQDWMKLAGIRSSEITDESVFRQRRKLLQAAAAAGMTGQKKPLPVTTIFMSWAPTKVIR